MGIELVYRCLKRVKKNKAKSNDKYNLKEDLKNPLSKKGDNVCTWSLLEKLIVQFQEHISIWTE